MLLDFKIIRKELRRDVYKTVNRLKSYSAECYKTHVVAECNRLLGELDMALECQVISRAEYDVDHKSVWEVLRNALG